MNKTLINVMIRSKEGFALLLLSKKFYTMEKQEYGWTKEYDFLVHSLDGSCVNKMVYVLTRTQIVIYLKIYRKYKYHMISQCQSSEIQLNYLFFCCIRFFRLQ